MKMDGWKIIHFLLGMAYLQGRYVSFKEGNPRCLASLVDLHPAIGATSGYQVTRGRKPGRWWEVATILVSLVGMKKTYISLQICGFICIFVNLKCIYIYTIYIYKLKKAYTIYLDFYTLT